MFTAGDVQVEQPLAVLVEDAGKTLVRRPDVAAQLAVGDVPRRLLFGRIVTYLVEEGTLAEQVEHRLNPSPERQFVRSHGSSPSRQAMRHRKRAARRRG